MNTTATSFVPPSEALRTPLYSLHQELGARLVPFAGYHMPVQYPAGLMAEHLHTRSLAGLFDVSHMGQIRLTGPRVAQALESLVPMDVQGMDVHQLRYAFFTTPQGGILDDLIITRRPHDWLLVVNAACKEADLQHLQSHIGSECSIEPLPDRALLALQGPEAAAVLGRLNAQALPPAFMSGCDATLAGIECYVTRSGYTGEDGFEISLSADHAVPLARTLLADPLVRPIGLGARDTLRLEAGLCLYGHDIHTHTSPIEAALGWAIPKIRRPGGARVGGYPGADVIHDQLHNRPSQRRVGLVGQGRVPVREGCELFDAQGHKLGVVSSGTFSPSLQRPVAMGYVALSHTELGSHLFAQVRSTLHPMEVAPLPFVQTRYHRSH